MSNRYFAAHVLGPDTHTNRPAASGSGTPNGAMYVCSTHAKIYRNNNGTWVDWWVGVPLDAEAVRDAIGAALVAGANMTITVDDSGDTITFASTTDPEVVRDAIGAALVAGSGMTITPDDAGNTITLASTGTYSDEQARDAIAAALVAGTGMTITVNDAGDTITLDSSGSYTDENARDALAAALVAGTGMTITVDDAGNTITLASTGSYTDEQARDAIGSALVAGSGITISVNDAANTITISAGSSPTASTFVSALYGQAGASVVSVSAPLPTHLAGDLLLVMADTNPSSYLIPDGWIGILDDSGNGTGVYFQVAPDTSTTHTLTSSSAQWSNWMTSAYRGASLAELIASYASNVSSAVSVPGSNRILYLAVGAGGVIGTPSGLTKRADGVIGSLSLALFDAEPVDGVLGGFTFTNAVKVYSFALYPEDVQVYTTPEQVKLASLKNSYAKSIDAQTGTSYTLLSTDAGKVVTMTNASASTLTVPPNSSVPFPVGTVIEGAQLGAGQVTLTPGSGVTINGTPGLKTRAQYSDFRLLKTATNTWLATGDLSA